MLNATVDFNEIQHKCLPTLLFERPKFSRNLKKSKFENFHIKKGAITFAQGCTIYTVTLSDVEYSFLTLTLKGKYDKQNPDFQKPWGGL